MGVFDKTKKKGKNNSEEDIKLDDEPIMTTSSFIGKNGKEIIEYNYIDIDSAFKKTYDTIRLIVMKDPVITDKKNIAYNALVSWYGQNDDLIDDMYNRKDDFTRIQLGIDFDKMKKDPEYRRVVMTDLLEKSRVEMYISDGLKNSPSYKCGNYVGYVVAEKGTGRYRKEFNKKIGELSHDRPKQVERREQFKKLQAARNAKIISHGIIAPKHNKDDLEK